MKRKRAEAFTLRLLSLTAAIAFGGGAIVIWATDPEGLRNPPTKAVARAEPAKPVILWREDDWGQVLDDCVRAGQACVTQVAAVEARP
jgi:hypothetical protein